jgi:hypothetical protein
MDACAPRVVFAIVSLGVLVSACSGPSGPSPLPSRTAPALPATALPSTSGVSWLRVSPEQGAPGSAVSLDVACLDTLGVVHSPVLDIGALKGNPDGHQPWHLFGPGTVSSDAAPGRYQVSATCGAAELSTAFTVVPAT